MTEKKWKWMLVFFLFAGWLTSGYLSSEFSAGKEDILELEIPEESFLRLVRQRNEALQSGVLNTGASDWVEGLLRNQGMGYDISLRLKGDWTDHLQGEKWSFRIRMKEGQRWRGMQVFSVQDPPTRNFMKEMYFHQALSMQDVLSTEYGFIPVKINGQYKGVFAYESHFGDALAESMHRPAGPFLRFDEEAVWKARAEEKKTGYYFVSELPLIQSAEILPFASEQENSYLFKQNVTCARDILNRFRFGKAGWSECLDLEKFGRLWAIADLFGAQHSLFWQNIRFYYDPLRGKIEPAAFDGFTGTENLALIEGPFSCYRMKKSRPDSLRPDQLMERLWEERDFLRAYFQTLDVISTDTFRQKLISQFKDEIRTEALLRNEYPIFSKESSDWKQNAENIRHHLVLDPAKIKWSPLGEDSLQLINQSPLPAELSGPGGATLILWPDEMLAVKKGDWQFSLPGLKKTAHRIEN